MAILLIVASWLATFAAFHANRYEQECLRSAFLKTSVIHAVIIAIVTELLSLNQSLTFEWLVFYWGLLALINSSILIFLIYFKRRRIGISQIKHKIVIFWRRQDMASLIAVFGAIIVATICLVAALVIPPHNYDSMTYNLPRVMHWIQNRSVAHYPTHNLRQISFPPGTGYIITHLQILSRSDRFVNCVQWLAFLGSVLGTSLIAKNLGSIQSQSITALVCASIPMAIMQSNTPQTDLTVSFWLVCFAYFIFRTDSYSKPDLFWLSASLGLAILAKPTGIIFGLPLIIVLCFRIWRCFPNCKVIFRSIRITLVILVISLSFSLPSYWRNYETFGKFIGIDLGTTNTKIGLSQFTSNILRNLALSMPVAGFWQFIENLHKFVLNININEPDTTFQTNYFKYDTVWWRLILPEDENYVGNPVHLTLLCIAIVTFISGSVLGKNKKLSRILSLIISNIIGFLLFSLLIKWQVWGNRLLLPLYILNAPVIGYFISSFLFKPLQRILPPLLIYMALIYSITPLHSFLISLQTPITLSNISQIQSILLLRRAEFYFRGAGPELKEPYTLLTNQAIADNCYSIGLNIGSDDWEYPLWPLMYSKGLSGRIKHINVQNTSNKLRSEFPDNEMCAIFNIEGLRTKYVKLK